jgi:hypothetical protein
MKIQNLRTMSLAVIAILSLTIFTQVRAASEKGNENSLIGTWNLTVTMRVCESGTVIGTFLAMNTYNQGGTTNQTAVPNSPFRDLPGHGAWSHSTGRNFSGAFQFFSLDPNNGSYVGKVVVRSDISLGIGGNEYSSTDTAEVFDPAGNVIFRACSTSSATRFQ